MRNILLIISFVSPIIVSAQSITTRAASQDSQATLCGRVVAISCDSPSSPAMFRLTSPSGNFNWRIVILPERRQLFGPHLEDRYDERLVCVRAAAADAGRERVVVSDPAQIMITDTEGPMPLPDDVARTCDPNVQLPKVISGVGPQYTSDAMRERVRGSIIVQGIVDRDGTVRDIRVVQSLEESLDASARKAFAQWRFRPATRNGEPVAMAVTVEMTFTMR